LAPRDLASEEDAIRLVSVAASSDDVIAAGQLECRTADLGLAAPFDCGEYASFHVRWAK
jgi:hypothetical protein